MSLVYTPSLFDVLPPELIYAILANLSDGDAAVVRRVSRAAQRIANAELMVRERTEKKTEAVKAKTPSRLEDYINLSGQTELALYNDGSMSTGRSLLLNRNLKLPSPMDMHFSRDNYMATLEITEEILLGLNGKQILDVGCGLSIFGSEAAVIYSITVDRIDLNAGEFRAADIYAVMAKYIESMALLFYMQDHAPYLLSQSTQVGETQSVLNKLRGRLAEVIHHYLQSLALNPIRALDATHMPAVADDRYDGVVCSWVLMYLTEEAQERAMREMVRVTRIGGQIRILPGNTLLGHHRILRKKVESWCTTDTKPVNILSFTSDGLMVLKVIERWTSCVIL
jgi:ubiquinone/menaquinone biosynthesis C-methylase UbiE